jgi:hypothetical protein
MKDTCGQPPCGSLGIANPPSSSESRLPQSTLSDGLSGRMAEGMKRVTDRYGSTLYSMDWKRHITPAGRLLFRLAASGVRTSGNDCTSWRSPRSSDGKGGVMEACPETAENLASWVTPAARDEKGIDQNFCKGEFNNSLPNRAQLTTWATPRGEDSECAGAHRGVADGLHSQARLTASGPMPNGSHAKTESTGQPDWGYTPSSVRQGSLGLDN